MDFKEILRREMLKGRIYKIKKHYKDNEFKNMMIKGIQTKLMKKEKYDRVKFSQ